MRKIDIKKRKDTDVTDEALYALDKESHEKIIHKDTKDTRTRGDRYVVMPISKWVLSSIHRESPLPQGLRFGIFSATA